ncbi:unnamed protein product [Euphydryas editha]|uniref:Peptidase S1 domain-containing protein n=1 Tax=Euphydryas editha TaxID=104508 RepID=A0AAU9VFM2_EUPED|nr:unnamed protein product [Euphydryas editha]
MCAHVVVCAALLVTLLAMPPVAAHELADDDSDDAAYMMVLQHADGWQCAASLVSTRTGVTTARCARGPPGAPRELWALAAALLAARPPPPPAAAARRVTRVAFAGDGRDPADPALDIAVVEMESPFATEAHAQPIIMATTHGFDDALECYSIRALAVLSPDRGVRRARFRVVSLMLKSETHCAGRVPHWSASHARSLCFTGDELCERDMGGGVVCGGELCAVLSVTAGDGTDGQCGETYAAQNISRWRSFLHCAHTLRLCGRGTSKCSEECSELILGEEEDSTTLALTHVTPSLEHPPRSHQSTRASRTSASSPTSTAPLARAHDDHASHPSIEFEPNRADFKAAPSRTPRPGLKAGEYGDNAAEYGAYEPPAPPPAARPSRTPPAAALQPTTTPPAPPAPALQASAPPLDHSTSACSASDTVLLFRLLIYSVFCMRFNY